VVIAGQFPPGTDGGGALLPVQPVYRVLGYRAEGVDGPGQGVLGGVLADPVLAGIHQRGDLFGVGAAARVGDGGDLRGPRPGRQRDDGAQAAADPGVDDGRDVARSGQVSFGEGLGQDAGRAQPGQFGGAQGAPQPPGLVAGFGAVAGRQRVHEQVAVVLVAGRGGLGGPDRMQDREVVGVGQGLIAGLGGRDLLAVVAEHGGQHAERRARRGRLGGRGGLPGPFGIDRVVPGQLGSRPRAGHRVGAFRGDGDRVAELGIVVAAYRKGRPVQRRCPVRGSASRARRTSSPSGVTASMREQGRRWPGPGRARPPRRRGRCGCR